MNILVLTNLYPPDYLGGYELGCAQAVAALRRRGHSVTVLTTTPRAPVPDEPGVLRRLLLSELVFDHRRVGRASPGMLDLRRVEGSAFRPHNVQLMLETLGDVRPDVVYVWNVAGVGTLGLTGALAFLQVPVTWHLMDDIPANASTLAGHPIRPLASLLSRELRANYLCCSERLVKEIEAGGYGLQGRVALVPNWVSSSPSDRHRSYYPDGSDTLRLVSAGQLLSHKGIDVVLHAARELIDRGHANFAVDLYGEGEDAHYQRLIHSLGLEARVRLSGRRTQQELDGAYWSYDVFLFPTWRREPFAFAPLEAAFRGCVPMISWSCGNAEWCVDGVDCIKVEPDARALAVRIEDALEGRLQLAEVGRRARAVVGRAFHIDRIVVQIEDALLAAQAIPARHPGRPEDAVRLAQLGDRLVMDTFDTL